MTRIAFFFPGGWYCISVGLKLSKYVWEKQIAEPFYHIMMLGIFRNRLWRLGRASLGSHCIETGLCGMLPSISCDFTELVNYILWKRLRLTASYRVFPVHCLRCFRLQQNLWTERINWSHMAQLETLWNMWSDTRRSERGATSSIVSSSLL